MKEIIKPGRDKFIGTCTNCGCQFSYELEDVRLGSVLCPYCKESYIVHKLDINSIQEDKVEVKDDKCCCGTCNYMDTSVVFTSNPPKFRCLCPDSGMYCVTPQDCCKHYYCRDYIYHM